MRLVVTPIQVLTKIRSRDYCNLFPNERERLFHLLEQTFQRLFHLLEQTSGKKLILSGDRHVGGYYYRSCSESRDDEIVEVTSSSLMHSVPHGPLDHEVNPCRIGNLVHEKNFGLLEIEPETNQIEVTLCSAKTGERRVLESVAV
jgi:alkaline phosphatase D